MKSLVERFKSAFIGTKAASEPANEDHPNFWMYSTPERDTTPVAFVALAVSDVVFIDS
ncbi:hypothetical protein [Stutzerimonas nitrititolerans]|uniref:hypothetical protein n=1 Tax=Stutzerimonas nitrititolerans TaxID=2482751 RepID=UPI00289BA82F|nr:hypothetical protein [Stutzerimonas nitrititolerans]